jgi:hypothetical protein
VPTKKEKQPLSVTHPELAKEADGWDPALVILGSVKKLSWKCSKNHIFLSSPNMRTANKNGCPYCSGRRPFVGESDLGTTHPHLAKEALDWNPQEVTAGSHSMKRWICSKGHIWEALVKSRALRGDGCPICSGTKVLQGYNDLLTTNPVIALEAHGWNPQEVSAGSSKKLNWKCKLGHIYVARVADRAGKNSQCPFCTKFKVLSGFNDLLTTHPEIAKEADDWDPSKVMAGDNRKKSWRCARGHNWMAQPNGRTGRGDGCPYCAGRLPVVGETDLQTTHPVVAGEAAGWDPRSVTRGSNRKLKWKCTNGHFWNATVGHRTSSQSNCPSCAIGGFDPNRDGYLYFLSHLDWEMFQVGITNFPNERINKHKKLGWELLELRGPMDGHLTQQWETAILRMLKAKGADLSNAKIAGKFDGYSEAWSKSTFEAKSIKELMRLTEEFEENV